MMKNKTYSLFRNLAVFAVALLLVSCGGAKKFVYLNDMQPGEKYEVNLESATIIHPNDRLDIKVSCKNPELAVPFNAQM
jgi:polysaccharide export outer membrane protein